MSLPNIILVTCHDLGRYLGCYGRAPIESPNLDRLAGEGIRFTNHFCTAPSCSPSRGGIITGRYPHSNGLMGLVNLGWDLPSSEVTMPQHLKRAGYETHLFGLQHERKDRNSLGYDHVSAQLGRDCASVGKAVVEFLRSDPKKPFFASIGTFETHSPFRGPEFPDKWGEVYIPPFLPDHPEIRTDMVGFSYLLARLDVMVGSVLAALESIGLSENTLFVFTTDHGIDMPRAKGTLYDPGIETTLLMRWPRTIRPGTVSDALLSNVDLLPTLMEIAGLRVPQQVQGVSFADLLEGKPHDSRDAIFAEKTHHCHYDPMRCIRTGSWKYIFNFGPLRPIEVPADGRMNVLAFAPELYRTRRPIAELYDLRQDPLEINNLCGDPQYRQVEEELKDRLRSWMAETGDPLLEGVMPIPKYL